MTKREKFIILLAFLAILYGGYEFLIAGPSKDSALPSSDETGTSDVLRPAGEEQGEDLSDLRVFVVEMNKEPGGGMLPAAEARMIENADSPWRKTLFIDKVEASAKEKAIRRKGMKETSFVYSGYMDVAGTRIAIINGLEYQVGEELSDGGFTVSTIQPSKVIISIKGEEDTIVVPLLEERLF